MSSGGTLLIKEPEELISEDATLWSGIDSTKYGIINPSTGQYNLEIKSLKDSDIGQYGCSIAPDYYITHALVAGKYLTEFNFGKTKS